MNERNQLNWVKAIAALTATLATCSPLAAKEGDLHNPERPSGPGIPRPKTRPEVPTTPSALPAENESRQEASILFPGEVRSIDGRENNEDHPEWGAAESPFLRLFPSDYDDGASSPAGPHLPSARAISNAVMDQEGSTPNARGATDYLWQWGQFLDHDITETPAIDPAEPFNIEVPAGDPWFDPNGTGTMETPMNRSYYEEIDGVREQVNEITAFIDASNVYGSSEERAFALRALDGSGKLKTTASDNGDLLPYNFSGLDNAGGPSPLYFLAGDVRANEQLGLTAMHTLFVREHNHWALTYRDMNPETSGEECYQFARMIVGAEMQRITYHEFLPLILGRPLPDYQGYRPDLNPGIANSFATGGYRFGHSLLSSTLLRVDAQGDEIDAGHLSLADAFFNPSHIEEEGIDPVLRGLAAQACEELDAKMIDEVRNLLFGPPGSGGLDLAALNIQRGRDHGLPSYNSMRETLNQPPARTWREVNPDPEIADQLSSAYENVEDIECWVGMLCEPQMPGAMVGPLLHRVLTNQFMRLRDGDRFWYQNHLPQELIQLVEDQTLAGIIRRNTEIGDELPPNVFLIERGTQTRPPEPRRRSR
jgi:peroxidase